MGSHGRILGDYPLTGRVVDVLMAVAVVVIAMAIAAEVLSPGGTAGHFNISNDVGIFFVTWGALIFVLVAVAMAVTRLRRRCRRMTAAPEELTTDEAELLREIHGRLGRMEERIEALETLVVDDREMKPEGRP